MSLDDIAAGLEVTTAQRDRGVAVADDTGASTVDRLRPFADALPCTPEAAATVVSAYAAGGSVGDAARDANVAPVTAAKTLYLLGEEVFPFGPTGRDVVRDWLDARISRTTARRLTDADDDEFALAVYVETHDRIPAAEEAVADALAVERDDPLADARSGVDDLL